MLRFLPVPVVLAILTGCSGYVSYEHRDFWRNAQLVHESPDQYGSEDPSIDPGDSIVIRITDGAYPRSGVWTTGHSVLTTYTIELPGDVRPEQVVNVYDKRAIAVMIHSGYEPLRFDEEAPFDVQVHVISISESQLKARIDADIGFTNDDTRPGMQRRDRIRFHGTEIFQRKSEWIEGSARMWQRIEADMRSRQAEEGSTPRPGSD